MASIIPTKAVRLPDGTYKPLPGTRWRAMIKRAGSKPMSKTWDLKSDAEQWARNIELRLAGSAEINLADLRNTLVLDVIKAFRKAREDRKGYVWEGNRLTAWEREPWAAMSLDQPRAIYKALCAYRDNRLKGLHGYRKVDAQTIVRDFKLLKPMFDYARTEMHLDIEGNPARDVSMPGIVGDHRQLVWTDADVAALLQHLGFTFDEPPLPAGENSARWCLPWLVLMLRYMGNLRLSNIAGLRFDQLHLEQGYIRFEAGELKNSEAFNCPLDDTALTVLQRYLAFLQQIEWADTERLFPSTAATLGTLLRRERDLLAATKGLEHIKNLRPHDFRHTWTTELINGLGGARMSEVDKLQLLKMTGRKSMLTLQRYFNPDVATLRRVMPNQGGLVAKLLNQPTEAPADKPKLRVVR